MPPPVEIQQIDPRKLEAIRKQWRKQSDPQQLLLDKNKSLPSEKMAPPNARYFSDRNIRVEKEQRAKQTNVVPKPRTRIGIETAKAPPAPRHYQMRKLGIPLHLAPKTPTPPEIETQGSREESPAADQAIQDKNLPEGGENLLNAQESVYYSFYARLYETIGPIWQGKVRQVPYRRRVQPGDYTTSVDVVLDEQGNLIEVRHVSSSGITEFDSAVDLSWQKVGHFPNPPHGLLDSQGRIHTGWTFTVQVGKGYGIDYLPPERNY